jgi:hypothetical protein
LEAAGKGEKEMKGFGLVHLKGEGKPIHPDDVAVESHMSDEWYLRQLQQYKDAYGFTLEDITDESCVRPHLLKDLK